LILTTLAAEPTHGYGVIQAVKALSEGDVVLRPGFGRAGRSRLFGRPSP
jgi:DNA-binding PadR family transcriptional regulator